MKDANHRQVAVKISKNKKFDIDNAQVEIKMLQRINDGKTEDKEGQDCVIDMIDSFKFRQHAIIVFEVLGNNLFK